MKEEILKWEIPNIPELKNRNIGISFDNNEVIGMLPEDKEQRLYYHEYDAKFAIYDKKTKEVLFTFSFLIIVIQHIKHINITMQN